MRNAFSRSRSTTFKAFAGERSSSPTIVRHDRPPIWVISLLHSSMLILQDLPRFAILTQSSRSNTIQSFPTPHCTVFQSQQTRSSKLAMPMSSIQDHSMRHHCSHPEIPTLPRPLGPRPSCHRTFLFASALTIPTTFSDSALCSLFL